MMHWTVYGVVLHKEKPLFSATSHMLKINERKAEGVRFNSLPVQTFSEERKMQKVVGKIL